MFGIFAAFIIASIVAILFSPHKRTSSLLPLVVFFFVLFFAGLSAQFWVIPFGPVLWGVHWLRIAFVVLVFALLFSSPPAHRNAVSGDADEEGEQTLSGTFGAFVWILLILLVLSIAVGLFYSDTFLAD